jgi:NADH:ubiquinone oxidoreductase subunit 5 (subunit L)/multisubunit Na+/H+ antiporter MnhA subunit
MSSPESLLAAAVAVPLAGSLALPLAGRLGRGVREAAALALVVASLACAAALLPLVLGGGTATVSAAGLALLHADRLAVYMALVSLSLGAVIVVYSFGYVAGLAHRGEYYLMVVLFLGAMMGLVFARHLLVLYACWELTAVACWRLIGFFRDPACVARAEKAFLLTAFGAVVMLVGFLDVYARSGTMDLGALRGTPLPPLAAGLILVGLFSKSATLPLHAWLPDAGVAPSPVTALLHAAVLVKIGVYVYARLFGATFAVDPSISAVVPWIAAASALVAGGAALVEDDLKRIIAYSTVSQIAFIFLGLSAGSTKATEGALLFILMHAIAKGGLFLCAGIVEHATDTKDLRRLGGLARRMPVTAGAFALCAFSVMGLPPFGGFFSKHLVVSGAFEAGRVPVALVFMLGSVLTLLYLARAFDRVFLGPPGEAVREHVHEGTRSMVGSVALLALLSLGSGLCSRWPAAYAAAVAQDVTRGAPAAAVAAGPRSTP